MHETTPHHEAGSCLYSPAEITQELAITLESMLDGYFSCDAQWRFVHINTSAERILGIHREDVIGKNHWEIFPLALGTRLEQEYRRAAAGEVREFENFYAPWNRWFHNRCFPRQGGGMAVYFREITERKQSECSVAMTQFLLTEAQKIAHVGSFEYIADTGQTSWSEEEYRIYGLDPAGPSPAYEEMLRHHIHPDDVALLDQTFTTALANGAVFELEHRIVRPNGEIRWLRNRAHPYFNEAGQLNRYIGTTLDVTEQHQALEALRASEERFRLFMDNSPTIAWVKDEHGRYVYLNKAFERCLMVSPADLMGKTDFEVWPEEVASVYHRNDAAVLDSGQTMELFEEAVNRQGDRSTWWLHKFPYADGMGRRYVAGTGVDITERKAAEERIRLSEERLRLALDASRMGSYCWDIARGDIFWSNSFRQIFGIAANSPASYDNWLAMLVPEDRKIAEQQVRWSMEGKSDFDCEYRICRPDGSMRWIAARGRFSYALDGAPQRMEGVVADITDKKNMEEMLVQERNMLQHVMNGAINVHLVYLDRDFNFIRVNEAYGATCGYSPEEMIGKNYFDLYPDAENEAIFKRVRDTGEPFTVHDKPFEFPDQAHRGVTYWDWALNPVKEASEVVTGLVFSLFETTERKRAEEEVNRLNANLEQQVAHRTEELEKALRALQASEHRYRSVVEDQTEIISRYRPEDNTFTFINETYCRFFGKTQEELLGRSWYPVAVSEDIPMIEDALASLSRDNPVVTIENRVYDGTGAIRWVQFSNRGIFDEQQQLVEIQSVGRDITERKHLENLLWESKEKFRALVEATSECIWEMDTRGCFTYLSPKFKDITGYPAAEFLGKTVVDLLPPDSEYANKESISAIMALPSFSIETTALHRNGQMYMVEVSGVAIFDVIGEFQGMRGITRDITVRKRLEEQLRESEEKFRALVETTSECIWETDAQGRFTYLSPKFQEMTGYAPEDFIGKRSPALLPENDEEEVTQRVLSTNVKQAQFRAFQHPILHKDGHQLWVDVSANPIFNPAGAFLGFRGVTRDVSEQKILTDALAASEERFRSLFEKHSAVMLLVDNQTGNIQDVNEAAAQFYGYPREKMQGMSLKQIVCMTVEEFADTLYRVNHENLRQFIRQHRLADGRIRTVEVNATPIPFGRKIVNFAIIYDITNRLEAEQEREQYFRLFSTSADLMCIADIQRGYFLKINPAGIEILGYSQQELLDRPYMEFIHPDDRQRTMDEAKRQIEAGFSLHFENRYLRKDGTIRWLSWRGHIDKESKLTFATARDITEYKRMVDALADREEHFRKLFEQHSAVMTLIDPVTGNVLDVNAAAAQFYGYSREAMQSMNINQINTLPQEQLMSLVQAVSNQQITHFTAAHRLANGRIRTVEVHSTPIEYQNRQLNFSISHDITDRSEKERQLRKAEAYARNLIEVNLDPLVTIDSQGRINDVNKASTLATGCSREEMIGTNFSSYFTEPDLAEVGYQQVFKTGMVQDYPLEIRHRDGHVTPVLYNATVFRDEHEEVAGVFAAARDITRLKHAEEQLRLLNAELEHKVEERTHELQETQKQVLHAEKLSAIGMLAASIAHEFNNPLQGIMIILNGLRKWAALEDKEKELADAAIRECERMKNLIRGLQDFNRPSSGVKSPMDVHRELDSLILLQTNFFSKKMIEVERAYAAALPSIEVVPDQIKQVFLNLLTNACDACGSGKNKITITTWRAGDRVAVSVADTGTGIAPENLERIFQPFFSTKDTVKGTGLGLSVSHGIVQAHGGEIRVESSLGKGAVFTVLLPIHGAE